MKTLRSMWWEMRRVRVSLDAGFSSRGELYTTHVESRTIDVMIGDCTPSLNMRELYEYS